jgi:rSAM/selenodomain-associated transferase 1
MTRPSAALAIFVKTPEISPVKTRLTEGVGREAALEFYRMSLDAVAATAAQIQLEDVVPYWAVAEPAGLQHPLWRQFRRIWQGAGDLGDRLAHVFTCLRRSFDTVAAIGVDSPQITPQLIATAFRQLRHDYRHVLHVLGRCHDGGFYLVGSSALLPLETWHDVPYSTAQAADRIAARLSALGNVVELGHLTDVDRAEDLLILRDELAAVANPTPEQVALLDWLAPRQ